MEETGANLKNNRFIEPLGSRISHTLVFDTKLFGPRAEKRSSTMCRSKKKHPLSHEYTESQNIERNTDVSRGFSNPLTRALEIIHIQVHVFY